ncbi:SgcJ/EcaC family oxidoreductase [Actinophytocola gossypii]|uniref:SgcJ/EcaC family oxidoreductase n=1 Tax=Actinophytocola gossypii TaxID=2812003 RepID=A0ABT2JG35_9PSEU|nr:SgcJ/EcaC family oxidoreductase [Actinophytocola gossypii]MCT2586813.1 SgcJ/EcaC family oxidoreductase [Actinophytocola gossypii]
MTTTETDSAGTQADQAAVAALTQRVVAAWAYNDADAFAALFTEDGTMILPGVYKKGRAAINEFLTEAYANQYKGTQVTGRPLDLRFVTPDVALLITYGGVLAAGESTMSDEQTIRATWTAVRQDGQWKLAAYQNSPALRQLPVPGTK